MTWFLFAVVILFFVWRMMPVKGVEQITTDELKERMKEKNVQLIDVRTEGEYGHRGLKEFTNIPLHLLLEKVDQNLDKKKETIVICQSGMRSLRACRLLKKKGFTKLVNVRGGMGAWS